MKNEEKNVEKFVHDIVTFDTRRSRAGVTRDDVVSLHGYEALNRPPDGGLRGRPGQLSDALVAAGSFCCVFAVETCVRESLGTDGGG